MTSDELLARGALPLRYHISSICAKANKVLRLVMRTFGSSNAVGMATGFKELVRLILKVPGVCLPSVESLTCKAHSCCSNESVATDIWP